jgi:ABC-type transport system involved in multi-copper enzyme maturation permease subunit
MIWHITRKELLVNLQSLRFLIGLVVSALMMGIVGYVLVEDYAARVQKYIADVQEHREALAQTKVYSTIAVVVDIPPSPLSVFSRGSQDLPTSVQVSPYHVPSLIDEAGGSASIGLMGTSRQPSNPLLRMFTSIDLGFVISTILSLFAVLLVFDSFSGEREQGTLKLLLSSSVGRSHLLAGKFMGALLTLAIPLTVGFLEVMILWALHPALSFDASVWAGVGLVYLASLLFLSGFLSLAMFLSLYAKESSSCLMYLLLAWVTVAVVIPAGGGFIAEYLRPLGLRENMLSESERASTEFMKALDRIDYRQIGSWNNVSTNPFAGESFLGITQEEAYNRLAYNQNVVPMKFQFAEDRFRVVESYARALRSWGRTRDNFIRPSLCVAYDNIVKAVAGTDIDSFDDIVHKARLYRDMMMAYLRPKSETPQWFTRVFEYPDVQPTESNQRYWQSLIVKQGERAVEKILSWDRVTPLDLSSMPSPAVGMRGAAERAESALPDTLFLFAVCLLFLALSILRMRHYPLN